jgi:hypothetical protein
MARKKRKQQQQQLNGKDNSSGDSGPLSGNDEESDETSSSDDEGSEEDSATSDGSLSKRNDSQNRDTEDASVGLGKWPPGSEVSKLNSPPHAILAPVGCSCL